MVSPRTWTGYDKDGNVLCRVTAVDANEYLNPAEVRTAVDNVRTTAEDGMQSIVTALNNVEPEASEAVIVQGTKMTETINQTCEALKEIPAGIADAIEKMYTLSEQAHDRLQNEANDMAYNAAMIDGVVSVK